MTKSDLASNAENKREHEPLISILIPVYKVEKYLEECLDSLVNQTFKDIEIICVNDGSTDGSVKILEKYKESDPRIVIINKENGGLPSARNAGLDAARGKYVGFVDSDDYVELNMFEKLYNTAEKENSEIVICGANIFPLDPAPNDWLYQVLSPPDKTYREFSPELIFSEPSSRPFIWRTFIKRDLIERNSLRLQEDILIGEDNAFQFRIYPLAKGVTLISDKLYNYRWYRDGSMMNSGVYDDKTSRLNAHVRLVEHIAEKWFEENEMSKMELDFLKWSVEFLYDDFIKIPLNDRIKAALNITSVWEKCGFRKYKKDFPIYISEMFKYFFDCANETPVQPKLSIIIPIGRTADFFARNLNNILDQNLHDIEVILINCGANDETYAIMHSFFHKRKNIRVFNQGEQILAKSLNIGIKLVAGEYFTFILPDDQYNKNILLDWYNKAESENSDICVSVYRDEGSERKNPIFSNSVHKDKKHFYLDSDYKNTLYKTDFIMKNQLSFNDYSVITGDYFLARACSLTQNISFYEKEVYYHRALQNESEITFDKCGRILEGIIDMMNLSLENNDFMLHTKAVSLLYNGYIHDFIIGKIQGFQKSVQNGNNNIKPAFEIWTKLLTILSLISPELISKCDNADKFTALPDMIYSFIDINHKWLADISNEYRNKQK